MNHDLKVAKSIEIKASAAAVWEVLTNPAIIKHYLHGTETITDWQVSSPIIFQGEYDGQTYKDKGIVQENKGNERLSYLYWSGFSGTEDAPENYSLVTYTIAPHSETSVLFTWEQKGFASETGMQHSEQGLMGMLEQIRDLAE